MAPVRQSQITRIACPAIRLDIMVGNQGRAAEIASAKGAEDASAVYTAGIRFPLPAMLADPSGGEAPPPRGRIRVCGDAGLSGSGPPDLTGIPRTRL